MLRQVKMELTDEHLRMLRALAVNEAGPGTILRDFAALLAFVRGRSLPVSKTYQLPPLNLLPQINALLSRPIEVRLQRPQLKSFPHIQGLYLLLRATGLGQIGGTPSKPVLVSAQEMYDAWSALNPIEQYFTLLEAWLVRGRPEIVGERDVSFWSLAHHFADVAELIHRAGGAKGLQVAGNGEAEWYWFYVPGRMGIALLEMFGLLAVTVRPPQEGEGWLADHICCTPLGKALFALLNDQLFSDLDRVRELEDAPQASSGLLQPILAPYVPQWQHTLAVPIWTFRAGYYVFKVSLDRDLWRQIAIDGEALLDELASAILDAYEFDHDHLYQFSYRNFFGVEERVHHSFMDERPRTNEVHVGDVPLAVGQTMTYMFDFGDRWEFAVTLEDVDPYQEPPHRPLILNGRGNSPEQYPDWG